MLHHDLTTFVQSEYDDDGSVNNRDSDRDRDRDRKRRRRLGCGTLMVLLAVDFFTILLLVVLYAQLHEKTCEMRCNLQLHSKVATPNFAFFLLLTYLPDQSVRCKTST